jgi:lipopolysaccharide biosynthesis glycosyltransferase
VVVVYSCNDFYIYQTTVSMVSLIKHNSDVKIYLISDHISLDNIKLMECTLEKYNQKVKVICADNVLNNLYLDQKDRHPRTIYTKLFLDSIIEEPKLLYLDSDTIVTGSLEKLYQRSMDNEIIAGVLMPYSKKIKNDSNLNFNDKYICDGVVLFNMRRWKAEKISEACRNYINKYNGNPPMLSEGTLNYVCRHGIGILKPEFNVMPSMLMYSGDQIRRLFKSTVYYTDRELEVIRTKYIIIHFMNELYERPWFKPSRHPLREAYIEIEKEAFGGKTIKPSAISKHTLLTAWLAEHLPFTIFLKLYHLKNGM